MSNHPNVLLILRLTPEAPSQGDNAASDLLAEIAKDISAKVDEDEGHLNVKIGDSDYIGIPFNKDTSYDDDSQISTSAGDIVFYTYATYDYGDTVTLDDLQAMRDEAAKWAEDICVKHHLTAVFAVGANYF